MPRTTKEIEKIKKAEGKDSVTKKSTTKKKVASAKKETSKTKTKAKKGNSKNDVVKKVNNKKSSTGTTPKTTSTKNSAIKKKESSSKASSSNPTKKTTTAKTAKANTVKIAKKSASEKKKTTSTKAKVTKRSKPIKAKKEPVYIIEYYDLPYRYNQTIVKVLAQTPTSLFVYWDISDDDRNSYISKYGENFFETTKPVLVIHNETMNYTYEIEINDFANSWYLHVNDPDCKYSMELGRRPKERNSSLYIPITYSNKIDAPNNHVLYNSINSDGLVKYRNVKSNNIFNKSVLSFIPNMLKIKDLHALYKLLYKDGIESIENSDINNPSSGSISSFK